MQIQKGRYYWNHWLQRVNVADFAEVGALINTILSVALIAYVDRLCPIFQLVDRIMKAQPNWSSTRSKA
jgi:hypothetical protein